MDKELEIKIMEFGRELSKEDDSSHLLFYIDKDNTTLESLHGDGRSILTAIAHFLDTRNLSETFIDFQKIYKAKTNPKPNGEC